IFGLVLAVVAAAHFDGTKKRTALPPKRHASPVLHRPFRPPVVKTAPREQPHPQPKPHPTSARVVLRAVSGDCWISMRVGSPTGRLVTERVLLPGQSVTAVARPRLWIRLGAPRNAVLTIAGRRLPALDTSSPVNLFVGLRGATAAPPGYVAPTAR